MTANVAGKGWLSRIKCFKNNVLRAETVGNIKVVMFLIRVSGNADGKIIRCPGMSTVVWKTFRTLRAPRSQSG